MATRNEIILPNVLLFEQVLEFIQQGKSVIIAVKGGSMHPFLREGERVLLSPCNKIALRRGCIVLARKNDKVLLHRVVKINKKSVWLAGDANLVQHEVVELKDIIAIVDTLFREERDLKLTNRFRKGFGMLWYWARPVRRIVIKLFK